MELEEDLNKSQTKNDRRKNSMRKTLKSLLAKYATGVLYFIVSLIIQCCCSVGVITSPMILLATLSGIIGCLMAAEIIDLNRKQENFSVDVFILKLFIILTSISFLFVLSTIGNAILSKLSVICLGVVITLTMALILYLAIKELINEYKKYKEKS